MIITIFGRENVGKSTLFNRLTENNKALVSKIPGTTRDIKYGNVLWRGKTLNIADTAGINIKNDTKINIAVQSKIKSAIDEADLILLLVDAKTGITDIDRKIAKIVMKENKPNILVANKVDTKKQIPDSAEFSKLGLGEPLYISAANGSGTGDLLDEIIKKLPKKSNKKQFRKDIKRLKISIVGQPNVGKSSILNAMLGQDKIIVTDIPHTTREPNDIPFKYKKNDLLLIDTAGITRKKRSNEALGTKSMGKSLATIKQSDIVLLVLDAKKMLTGQDQRLAGLISNERKGMIVVVNKWDLIEEKTTKTTGEFQDIYQASFPFLKGIPFIFVSAKEKQRIHKILDLALEIKKEMSKTISQTELNNFLKYIVKKKKPVAAKGYLKPRILAIEQTGTNPPIFIIVITKNTTLHFSYLRYIENQLRDKFGFIGSPIKLVIKKHK